MKILLTRIRQLTRPPSVLVDLKYLSSGMLAEVLLETPEKPYLHHVKLTNVFPVSGNTENSYEWSGAEAQPAGISA